MKNPFEKMFGRKEKSPEEKQEEAERSVRKVMAGEFKNFGVNYPGIHRAYEVAQDLNREQGLGLTRNHILNLLKEQAHASREPAVEDFLYQGGPDAGQMIDAEIENIRKEEADEPQV